MSFPITTSYVYPGATATIAVSWGGRALGKPLAVTPGSALSTGAWPRSQADARNTGRGKGKGAKGVVAWTLDFHGGNYGVPAIGSSSIAVTALASVSAELIIFGMDGAVLHTTPMSVTSSDPAAGPNGSFYVSSQTAVNAYASDGTVIWSCPTPEQVGLPVVGPDGTAYVCGKDLHAVSASGTLLWTLTGYAGNLAIGPDGTIYDITTQNGSSVLTSISASGVPGWSISNAFATPAVGSDGTVYASITSPGNGGLAAINPDGSSKWFYEEEGAPQCTPTVNSDGTIAFIASNGVGTKLVKVTSSSGSRRWSYPISNSLSPTSVCQYLQTSPDGTFFAMLWDEVLAVNSNGTTKWKIALPAGFWCPELAVGSDGSAYLGIATDSDSARNPATSGGGSRLERVGPTGKVDWTYFGGGPTAPPAIGADGTLYCSCEDGGLRTVSPAGKFGWSFMADSPILTTPTLGWDGSVYFGTLNGTLYSLSSAGKKKWSYSVDGAPEFGIYTAPALSSDGAVYVAGASGTLYSVDVRTGKLRWKFVTGGSTTHCSPAIATDGTIYFGSTYTTYALTPQGALKWQATGGDATPCVADDGTIYLGYSAWIAISPSGSEIYGSENGGSNGAVLLPKTQNFRVTTALDAAFAFTGPLDPPFVWSWGNSLDSITNYIGWGSLAADDTIYVPGFGTGFGGGWAPPGTTLLTALSVNGTVLWTVPAPVGSSYGTSIGADGTVYVVCDDRILYAVK